MQLGRLTLVSALLLPAIALAQGAPFCVFSGAGAQCYYYSLQACQQAARYAQGMCAPNQTQDPQRYGQSVQPAIQQQPQLQHCDGYVIGNYCSPDPGKKVMEAYNQARQQKMEREEHEARMALLRAQTQAASMPPVVKSPTPIYRCHANGQPYLTDKDAGGCVFLGTIPSP